MFRKEILSLFWSWVFKWQIYVTSEYTVNTQFREYIVLALIQKQAYFWVQKIDNAEMVIYKPASFVSKQISWKCKQIIKCGRSIDWFIKKVDFVKVILSPNFKKLFSEKSGLEKCFLLKNSPSINCINWAQTIQE